nr:MAG TPA_asm: hypothetical protein [Caudoviricetes sp.]
MSVAAIVMRVIRIGLNQHDKILSFSVARQRN